MTTISSGPLSLKKYANVSAEICQLLTLANHRPATGNKLCGNISTESSLYLKSLPHHHTLSQCHLPYQMFSNTLCF